MSPCSLTIFSIESGVTFNVSISTSAMIIFAPISFAAEEVATNVNEGTTTLSPDLIP